MILRDPFLFFSTFEDGGSEPSRYSTGYILSWFVLFSAVPCLLLPLWKPLTDWAVKTALVKIPDLHFGNAVYLSMAREIYPLVHSYLGDSVRTWIVCMPILMADLLVTLVFFAGLMHLVFRYLLGGNGRLVDALAVTAFGDLPSLLFGFLPYSAAVGLAWTTLLQIPVGFHFLYKVPWGRAFVPYFVFTLYIFFSWGTIGTTSPFGLTELIPLGPFTP